MVLFQQQSLKQLLDQNIAKTNIMAKNVLVYGSGGALGRAVVNHFKKNAKSLTKVVGIDLVPNDTADESIVVPKELLSNPSEQQRFVADQAKLFVPTNSLDAILVTSGGWAGGNAGAEDLLKNTENMVSSSLYASLIASNLASSNLGLMKNSGNTCLMLPGAAPAIGIAGTAFMIPYGVAKAGVHQLLNSLASCHETAGIDEKLKVFGIAPVTIDTEMNRAGMPDADFTSWTKPEELAERIERWVEDTNTIEQGKMYLVKTEGGKTSYE